MPITPSTHRFFAKTSESPSPSLVHSVTDATASPLLLSVTEAARLLNVSPRTVWSLTESGSLPHVRIGRRVLPTDLADGLALAKLDLYQPQLVHDLFTRMALLPMTWILLIQVEV